MRVRASIRSWNLRQFSREGKRPADFEAGGKMGEERSKGSDNPNHSVIIDIMRTDLLIDSTLRYRFEQTTLDVESMSCDFLIGIISEQI